MARIERESINFKLPKPLADALRKVARYRNTTATDLVIQGLHHVLGSVEGISDSVENRLHQLEAQLNHFANSTDKRVDTGVDNRLSLLEQKLETQALQLAKLEGAIADWLIASKRASKLKQPLFTVIAYNGNGKRLTGEAIRRLVSSLCKQVGIAKQMSPHRIRHSSITTVLDKNNGNYRATQRFSRHAKPDTVMKYDDNRSKLQKAMTDILADLV